MHAAVSQLAAYNRWANARIFAASLALPDEDYRRSVGVFFGSLHGTLNHLLVTDRIWLKRITGLGEAPERLDAILFEDQAALTRARVAEDERIVAIVAGFDETALTQTISYVTTSGTPQNSVLGDILLHLFNHQTHHRGHAHACCSIVSGREPPALDLIAFQRGMSAPDLATLVGP